jgi:hypothetical protein
MGLAMRILKLFLQGDLEKWALLETSIFFFWWGGSFLIEFHIRT